MPERFGSNESTYDALRGQTLGLPVSGGASGADGTYLRLDTTNDPLTGPLDIVTNNANALRVIGNGTPIADTVWLMLHSGIYYSSDALTAASPTWAAVAAVPTNYTNYPTLFSHVSATISGTALYAWTIVSGTTRNIWYCGNPKAASPTWVKILAIGDAYHSGTVSFLDNPIVHGEVMVFGARSSSGSVNYHVEVSAGVIVTETAIGAGASYGVPGYRVYYEDGASRLYSLAGAVVGTYNYRQGVASHIWQALSGGNRYAMIPAGNSGTTSDKLLKELGSDTTLLTNTNHAALTWGPRGSGLGSAVVPRGAYYGTEIDYVDADGVLWTSANGSSYTSKATWAAGVVEQATLTGGGTLVWAAGLVASGQPLIKVSIDGGTNWLDRTGNLWSLIAASEKVLLNMQVTFSAADVLLYPLARVFNVDSIGYSTEVVRLVSTMPTGISPLSVVSTTVNTNLNADLLDGNHASAFQTALTNPVTGTGTTDRVAKFTGASTIGDSNLIGAGAGTLTLSAANTHTATFPATGNDTVAMLGVANVFSVNQKVNANSTTALHVEQDGVNDDVLIVDTTNSRISQRAKAADESGTLGIEFLSGGTWTSTGWTGSHPFTHNTGNTTALSYSKAAVVTTYYYVAFTITGRTAGSVTVSFGGVSSFSNTASGSFGLSASATTGLVATPTTDFDGTILFSIKPVTANTNATYTLQDSAGAANFTIKSNAASLQNLFIGVGAGASNITGIRNTALGFDSLRKNISGANCFALGYQALYNNANGTHNIAIGAMSLYTNTSGTGNIAIGYTALQYNILGSSNIAIGYAALSGTTSSNSVAIGYQALVSATGFQNTAIGYQAGYNITVGAAAGGSNVHIGYFSGKHASQLVSAVNSIAIGADTYTTASNQIILGSTAITTTGLGTFSPAARLHVVSPSVAAGVGALLTIDAAGSGANGDGGQVLLSGKSSTTAAQNMAALNWTFTNATHASLTTKIVLQNRTSAGALTDRVAADGDTVTLTGATVQLVGLTIGNDAGSTTDDLRWETDTEENALLVDASADKIYIGGTTNGIEIEKGGKFKAIGTATWFDDVRVEPTVRSSGSKAPNYTAWTPSGGSASGLYFYLFDNAIAANEKEVNFKLQMPHGKLLGSAIHLHVHWMPTSTGSAGQKVRWGLEYSKANPNGVFAAPGAFIYATDPVSPPSTTPTQDTHYITEFADIDMTGDALSTILLCRLFRNSSDAADTFAGDVGLLYIDCHIEFSQLGSNEEYTQ